MARKRLLSPEFFSHSELYDAEARSGLPLRLAFAGLWTACDRRGLFSWKPRELKLDILPYDEVNFDTVLLALESAGFIERYVVDGKPLGRIPSFARWQTFHKHERPSDLPEPTIGRAEPSSGGPESDNGCVKPPVVITGTVTSTDAVAGSVAVAVPSAPARTPERPSPPAAPDFVDVLTADYDFGPFEPSVAAIVRSARHGASIIATLRMHLQGEMGHEHATPAQLGLACQQFLAGGKEFNSAYFSGFVRKAKAGIERVENRKRNDAETRHIASEDAERAAAAAEEAQANALLLRFAEEHNERFAELQRLAENSVPKKLTLGRDLMVRAHLLRLVRDEIKAA